MKPFMMGGVDELTPSLTFLGGGGEGLNKYST